MISGHLQTPDLSDHSGDEAKLTKPSGLELKTNELWSSDLEEELESRIMQPATFSSILKQFSSILEETIISKIMSNKNCDKNNWKKKIYCYRYFLQPLKEEPDVGNMKSLVEKLEKLKLKKWSALEIEQLFCNYLEDLTTSAVKVSIPGKTLDEVAAAVNNIHPRPRWTRKEIECLIKNENDFKKLEKDLFVRDLDSIKKKIRRDNLSIQNEIQDSEKKSPQSTDSNNKDSSRDLSRKERDQLKKLLSKPICFSELLAKFPGHSWEYIAREIIQLDSSEDNTIWLKKIYYYCVVYSISVDKEITKYIGGGNRIYEKVRSDWSKIKTLDFFKDWSLQEFERLYCFAFHDLTKSALTKNFPSKNLNDICKVVNISFPKVPYTDREMKYLERHLDTPMQTLENNLPFRSRGSIHKKLEALKALTETTEQKQPPTKTRPKNEEEKNVENAAYMKELIMFDLTLEAIENTFPSEPIEEIIKEIKNSEIFDPLLFTRGEKELMAKLVKKGNLIDDCFDYFPLREEEFIRSKYAEAEYVSGRKMKFNTPEERLAYEAKWTLFNMGKQEYGRGNRRCTKRYCEIDELSKLEQEASVKRSKKKIELTEEELEQRRKRLEHFRLCRLKKLEEKQEKYRIEKAKRLEKIAAGLIKPSTSGYELKDIVTSAEYFQSIVGDKQKVQEGQKRKRIQTEYFAPEFIEKPKAVKLKTTKRQAEKNKIKKQLKREAQLKIKKKKTIAPKKGKRRVKTNNGIIEEIKDVYKLSLEPYVELEVEEEDEEEDYISPYDPPDIISDSQVKLNGRHLYISSFYKELPEIPELKFVSLPHMEMSGNDITVAKQIMTTANDDILYDDCLAYEIVAQHIKSYRDLPISFPPILDPITHELNSANIVRIRFFLYPEHYELFMLASPKSNELDPVHEIAKLFMIQYSLYFSHSDTLKKIITEDYCHKLEHSVEENDFGEFMFVVDKWNQLVMKLSPNLASVQNILGLKEDINEAPRAYLNQQEISIPTNSDLKIETFYDEIMYESASPLFNPINSNLEIDSELAPIPLGEVEIPNNVIEEINEKMPDNYIPDFFRRLKEKTEVSRYAMQQILLRVYSRVVSTDSRKLRSYKAFTAETYGELLPSFTSEVLEKLNLLPTQKFYDLGSGVGNTTFQAALEFGACSSGGCEIMEHASKLTELQAELIQKHLAVLGLQKLNLDFALHESFVGNEKVRASCLDCDVLIINNYLFDGQLNDEVGKLLYGLRPGTKIVSLRNFISPRYRATFDTVFDFLSVEKHEMSDIMSVSWTANKVPYYISTVEETIPREYLSREETKETSGKSKSVSPVGEIENVAAAMMTPPTDSSESEIIKN